MRINKMNTCFRKKMIELSNENDSLSVKTTSVKLKNKNLYDELVYCKESIVLEYESSIVDDLKNKNGILSKKNIEPNDIVLKFINGQKDFAQFAQIIKIYI